LIVRALKPEINLMNFGSGVTGATNVMRAVGAKWGVVTMLLDCLKGLAPVLLARWVDASAPVIVAAGIAAFSGHVYSVFLGFKGGKGVATALGVFLGVAPAAALLALLIWAGTAYIARSTAIGALSAATSIPILMIGTGPHGNMRGAAVFMAFALAAFVFFTHRTNIRGIIRGDMSPHKVKNNP
jgi:glycerol-3-phosphate acyltransferase PlsY